MGYVALEQVNGLALVILNPNTYSIAK